MEVATLTYVDFDMHHKLIDNIITDEDLIKYKKESVQNDMTILDQIDSRAIIEDITSSGYQEDPFYVCDLGDIVKKYFYWREKMPRVVPYYGES